MAEDSINIPETPKKVELKGVHLRRNSTGNLSLAKGVVDVLPRYLGAPSVTSCHDVCKYGTKHEPQEKPWHRKSKRNPTGLGEQKDLVKDVLTSLVEGKKKVIIKNDIPASPKKLAVSSPYSPSPTANSARNASGLRPKPLERTSSVPGDFSRKKSSSETNKQLRKDNPEKSSDFVSTNKELSGNYKKRNTSRSTDKKSFRKASEKNPIDEDVPEKIIHTVDTKPENSTPKGNNRPSQPLSPLPENKKLKDIQKSSRTSLISSLSLSPRKRILRSSSPSVKKIHPRPIEKPEGASDNKTEDNCKVKNIDSLEDVLRNGDDQAGPSQQPLPPSPSAETKKWRRARIGSQASLLSSSSSLKKILAPVRKGSSSSSSTPSSKLRSRLPARSAASNLLSESENKTPNQGKATARPRRVKIVCLEDKVRTPKKLGTKLGKASSSSSLSHLASESTKNVEIDPNSGDQTLDVQVKRTGRHRRVKSAGLEDEVGSSKKLHFRRGKVVDIQPKNAVIPRFLKFKQRLLLGENQNGRDTWRRTMKKIVGGDESNVFSSGTMVKVALRHQSMEGKKEAKSLFNNVIEETAILLAQTRKSKVKALVGAFETVISLQDKKSSNA